MNTPYTYLLRCKATNQFYYGVRWSRNCNPSDFWKTYFTSSVYIKKLISVYGKDSFEYEIRKVFKTNKEAKLWEQKVLRRLNVAKRLDFLNKHDGVIVDFQTRCWVNKNGESKFIDALLLHDYISLGWSKGRIFTEQHKKKNSNGVKKWFSTNQVYNKGIPMSEGQKDKIRKSKKLKTQTMESNPNAKPITINGVTYPCVKLAMKSLNLSRYLCNKLAN